VICVGPLLDDPDEVEQAASRGPPTVPLTVTPAAFRKSRLLQPSRQWLLDRVAVDSLFMRMRAVLLSSRA
jgi:hypothetical protein